jgi:hypothetical protein
MAKKSDDRGPQRMEHRPHRNPHTGDLGVQRHRVGSNKAADRTRVDTSNQHEQLLGLAAASDHMDQQTPVEVDTAIADLYMKEAKAKIKASNSESALHSMAGDDKRFSGTRSRPAYKWIMTFDEVLKNGPKYEHQKEKWENKIQERNEAIASINEIQDQIKKLDAIYVQSGGWPRFFLVTNPGGHIHSSMRCSKCYPTTQYAWLPEISGQTEAEAVENYGGILCSTCYPSAPSDWTDGESKADKEVREEREREKQKRQAANLAKALMPDGKPLRLIDSRDSLKTQRSAEIWLTDSYQDIYKVNEERHKNDRELVLAALEQKTGKSREELLAETMKRVAAKNKREGIR